MQRIKEDGQTIDICYNCGKEAKGEYNGEYDNPIFICNDCFFKQKIIPFEAGLSGFYNLEGLY
jgi:hypothetical protein